MSIDSVYAEAEARARREVEGQSFLVLTTDPDTARAVAPLMAAELHPDRRFGAVLHVEPVDVGLEARNLVPFGIEVTLEDLGPARVRVG